jgi:uncharacterized membrane protein (DUF106 family)
MQDVLVTIHQLKMENELIEAINELTKEVRELKEILKPELKKTETIKRIKEERAQISKDAEEFLKSFDKILSQ